MTIPLTLLKKAVRLNQILLILKRLKINIIINKFENHPSIVKIKECRTVTSEEFKFIEMYVCIFIYSRWFYIVYTSKITKIKNIYTY